MLQNYLIKNFGFAPIEKSKPYKELNKESNKNNSRNPIMNKIIKYSFCVILSVCCNYAIIM